MEKDKDIKWVKWVNKQITTYNIYDDFCVDIIDYKGRNFHEAWIYNISYGKKIYMFGGHTETREEFIDMVKYNAIEHMYYYKKEVMDK